MKDEIMTLFENFNPSVYSQKYSSNYTSELFLLEKLDLFLRFRLAFLHGYLGIRYDDQYEFERIQHRLDELFRSLPSGSIRCRRLLNGRTEIFPHPSFFGVDIKNYPWSFIRKHQRYCDFSFSSHPMMERHVRLMSEIRKFCRRVSSLVSHTFMQCSTYELRILRTLISLIK